MTSSRTDDMDDMSIEMERCAVASPSHAPSPNFLIQDDIKLLDEETFDFDLAVSPAVKSSGESKSSLGRYEEEDEIFIGAVGFKETCAAKVAEEVEKESEAIKPMSPLTAHQMVELFVEAQKVASQITIAVSNESSAKGTDVDGTPLVRRSPRNLSKNIANTPSPSKHMRLAAASGSFLKKRQQSGNCTSQPSVDVEPKTPAITINTPSASKSQSTAKKFSLDFDSPVVEAKIEESAKKSKLVDSTTRKADCSAKRSLLNAGSDWKPLNNEKQSGIAQKKTGATGSVEKKSGIARTSSLRAPSGVRRSASMSLPKPGAGAGSFGLKRPVTKRTRTPSEASDASISSHNLSAASDCSSISTASAPCERQLKPRLSIPSTKVGLLKKSPVGKKSPGIRKSPRLAKSKSPNAGKVPGKRTSLLPPSNLQKPGRSVGLKPPSSLNANHHLPKSNMPAPSSASRPELKPSLLQRPKMSGLINKSRLVKPGSGIPGGPLKAPGPLKAQALDNSENKSPECKIQKGRPRPMLVTPVKPEKIIEPKNLMTENMDGLCTPQKGQRPSGLLTPGSISMSANKRRSCLPTPNRHDSVSSSLFRSSASSTSSSLASPLKTLQSPAVGLLVDLSDVNENTTPTCVKVGNRICIQ